jgi:hypothetical protein
MCNQLGKYIEFEKSNQPVLFSTSIVNIEIRVKHHRKYIDLTWLTGCYINLI